MKFANILLEGKKDNLIDKYKDTETFSDVPDLLEKLIDGDPSATKKYAEWMIKQMINLGDRLTHSIADNVNLFIELIENFHKTSSSITPEDIDYAASLSTLVNPEKIKSGPKDIYKYDSIWGLQAVLSAISKRKIQKEKEAEAKKDVEKIYEDNRFLILRPFSHNASCYYGANTKWCTTTKDDSRYFDQYSKEGSLFYIIDKQSSDNIWGKMALFVRDNGNIEVYDQKDSIRSLDVLLQRFEPLSEVIKKLVKGDDDYEKLKSIKEGKISPSRQKLSAPYFDSMDQEFVYLSFSDVAEYLSLFSELHGEYELQDVEYAIDTPYGYDGVFYDSYNFDDDIEDGYPLNALNQDHLKKLRKIFNLTGSDLFKCFNATKPIANKETLKKFIEKGNDLQDYYDLYQIQINSNCESKIGKFLKNFDSDFYDRFLEAYSTAEDESMKEGIKQSLTSELCEVYEEIGIIKDSDRCFDEYKIPIDNLLNIYESDLESLSGYTLDQLLKEVVSSNDVSFPRDPRELAYEVGDADTFEYHFNDDMDRALDNLIEKLEDSDDYADLDEYKRIYTFISNKYGFDERIPVETTDGDVSIIFKNVNPENNKIDFELTRRGDNYGFKKGRAKLSTIQQLMSNYQLFDPFED